MDYSVTVKTTKVAWIREPGYPVGSPAPGYFNCLCGLKITNIDFGQRKHVICVVCEREYDGHGWIKGGSK